MFGGEATVAVAAGEQLASAVEAARETAEAFDLACSRFRADSELEAVNRAAGASVTVGAVLEQAIDAALMAAEVSGGALDPTVGTALIALGYDRDLAAVRAGPVPAVRAARVPGWRTVELDRNRHTVRIPAGARLDLGATAKALAADVAAEAARAAAGCGVLVSFSGDLALAGEPPGEGWTIRVSDDHRADPRDPGQSIILRDGGLATSSRRGRRWETAAGSQHHLIDPQSGRPAATPWRTVSVHAATCLEANIASTALMVAGTAALPLVDDAGLSARLVTETGWVEHRHRWPADGEDLPVLDGPR
jgi:thiamine biosynthesis lipoprotein